jgi:hypothetical protein
MFNFTQPQHHAAINHEELEMGTGTWIARTAAALAAACALLSTPAQAVNASIYVQIAPPPVQYEAVPAPRHQHAWVPGHWSWDQSQYVWVPGHFERVRVGHYYDQPRWVQQGSNWGYVPGGWRRNSEARHGHARDGHGQARDHGHGHGHGRDRDHGHGHARDRDRDHGHGHRPVQARGPDRDRDGIPDRRDRDLDNDGRPNHRDRDRDGDGVPNRHDARPDNRWRN